MQTVGEILRTEREKKGLSIKDIEAGTSIRALYITAIEEDNYGVVPGEVYLKGFIRNYATYLGLDSQQVITVYKQSQAPVSPTVEEVTPEPAVSPKEAPQESRPATKRSPVLGLVALLVVALAGGSAWWFLSGDSTPKTEPPKPQTVVTTPAPAAPTSPAPAAAVNTTPVTISAKFNENCWIAVSADGKEVYQGTAKLGEILTWQAQQNITIKAGNAGGIDVTHNGQALGKLGEKGEVIVKTFTAKL